VSENPKYLMNTESGEIYAFSVPLSESKNPRFVPYAGDLPSFDLKLGARIARIGSMAPAAITTEMTAEERIERLAAVVHLVPPSEVNDKGVPSLLVVEKLSGLSGVKRAEVTNAMKVRAEILRSRNRIQNPPKLESDQEIEDAPEEV